MSDHGFDEQDRWELAGLYEDWEGWTEPPEADELDGETTDA